MDGLLCMIYACQLQPHFFFRSLLIMYVTLVGHWPDLGPKCGARADFFLMQLTWYAKGMVQSDL